MKIFVLLVFSFLSVVSASAQSNADLLLDLLPLRENKVTYTATVNVDTVKQAELYRRARVWLVNTYRSSKDVIQLEDKENATLIGKGYLPTTWQITFMAIASVNLQHTIKLQFKDGRYRYEITDFVMDYFEAPTQYTRGGNQRFELERLATKGRDKNTKKYYAQVNEKVTSMIAELEKAMLKPEKDW